MSHDGIVFGIYVFSVLACLLLLSGCSTSLHGSFIEQSFATEGHSGMVRELGRVEGRSCQTRVLYVLASGEPATTDAAIEDAKTRVEKTRFLADISIDDETEWSIGYSVQCIVVRATAYE